MAVTLNVSPRELKGKKVGKLRREGWIPAVLGGKGLPSREVAVSATDFSRMEHRITPTTLLDVVVQGEAPVKALLARVQHDPRTSRPLHLELHQVRMEDKIKVQVPIHVEGTAPAVSGLGGALVIAHDTVEVRCDPAHLISRFNVDVSRIATFDDHVRVEDIVPPEGVEFLTPPETILVSVTAPSKEPEEIAPPTPEEEQVEPAEAPEGES